MGDVSGVIDRPAAREDAPSGLCPVGTDRAPFLPAAHLGIWGPVAVTAVLLLLDLAEGPRIQFVGLLVAMPFFASRHSPGVGHRGGDGDGVGAEFRFRLPPGAEGARSPPV